MKRLLLTLLPAMLSMSQRAAAQDSATAVPAGARVRFFVIDTVDAGSGQLRYTYPAGTLVAFDSRALVLRSDSANAREPHAGDTLRVPVTNVYSGEEFAGMKRHPIEGGVIGLVVGGFVGLIAGDHAYGRTACAQVADIQFCSTGAPTKGDTRRKYIEEYGGASTIAGAAIGYFVRTERWSSIDIGRLRLQVGLRP